MKKVIHEYTIPFGNGACGEFSLETHAEGTFLHVGMQGVMPCIWAEVDVDSPPAVESLAALATGQVVPEGARYLGTWVDLPYVRHLYALKVKA